MTKPELRSLCRRTARDEHGAVVVLVALCLFALMAMTAFAIDLSVLYNARRSDQNAADHSALAAAWASCNGRDPIASGRQAAADNGYDNDGVSNTVSLASVGANTYAATITSSVDALFAGVVNVNRLDARGRAVATCTQDQGSNYAIFAFANCGDKTIDWSGSSTNVKGLVHSNAGFYIGGSGNSVTGASTYVTKATINAGNTLNPKEKKTSTQPWPVNFNVADYAPGGSKAAAAAAMGRYYSAGNSKIDKGWLESRGYLNNATGQLRAGLYYSNADIDVSASNLKGNVTFVSANGKISLSGSSHDLTPYVDSLLAFSNKNTNCGDAAVAMSGSSHKWSGIIHARRGMIEMSGSSNATLNGSLIGEEVRLNGSVMRIDTTGSCCQGKPRASLLE